MILRPDRISPADSAHLPAFFADAERRMAIVRLDEHSDESMGLGQFFFDAEFRLNLAIASQQDIDEKLATGFNVFELIEPDENKLSDILADLLNPTGSHGQRDLFLRLLFERLGLSPAKNLADIATVRREAPTGTIVNYRRRIDILVEAGALIGIENKVDSSEQPDQAKDYIEDLDARARQQNTRGALIYLSPDGQPPRSLANMVRGGTRSRVKLHPWRYQKEIRHWLRDCRDHCEAERIRNFLSDFTDYIDAKLGPRWESVETHPNES